MSDWTAWTIAVVATLLAIVAVAWITSRSTPIDWSDPVPMCEDCWAGRHQDCEQDPWVTRDVCSCTAPSHCQHLSKGWPDDGDDWVCLDCGWLQRDIERLGLDTADCDSLTPRSDEQAPGVPEPHPCDSGAQNGKCGICGLGILHRDCTHVWPFVAPPAVEPHPGSVWEGEE